ncbi:MAG: glutamate-5-semialdehyde dehydrogenase [Oscillospiraceae bacterium]|nr:glutamate-5-semialdehyde dehydrogenase [Oscillospiraceae bacterium]
MGEAAVTASRQLAVTGTAAKNTALEAMALALEEQQDAILAANAEDIAAAVAAGIKASLIDRLRLTPARIGGMADGLREVAALPDPIGEILEGSTRPNGLRIQKIRVPMGVIGIIYEARPNVTADAAALCLKSGNACILRGGKEAIRSNMAVTAALAAGLAAAGLPEASVQLIEDTDRETAREMMGLNGYINVLIPRGGAGLIRSVVENATVPVIETGSGVCHIYVDNSADIGMAADITVNAKCSRPSVCNAAETLLVHHGIAPSALPLIAKKLIESKVELRCCERAAAILKDYPIVPAAEEDWATEYGDYIISIKVVDSLDSAVAHINKYGTGHSECIVTESKRAADKFMAAADAAAVYCNASTRYTDGGEFGMGAEIGISTQKMHARGPMGLRELTSVKYLIHGDGQIRV